MTLLRTLSTRSLLLVAVAAALLIAGGTTIALAASGGSGRVPPHKPLSKAIHTGLTASEPAGITARVRFTNNLIPNGALLGQSGSASALMGASGRLWVRNDGHGRLELQSNGGDAQVVWRPGLATIYDASSNTVYRITLPAEKRQKARHAPPSVAGIGAFLTELTKHVNLSSAQPSNVGGRSAYTVRLSPKEPGGLVGSVRLAWDATHGVPLRAAIYARGVTAPVLELRATSVRYGAVPLSTVDIAPPAGARVVELSPPQGGKKEGRRTKPSFQPVAPQSLAGLKRTAIRPVGQGVLVVYGEGLGAITVLEHQGESGPGGPLAKVPTVQIDGVRVHELATPLATVLAWQRGGLSYLLAGSVKPSVAESAARDLH